MITCWIHPVVICRGYRSSMAETGGFLRVGEVAEATGLTVRTLHYYDEIDLVQPSHRTSLGHRGYTPDDLRRLDRVVALRRFGIGRPHRARVAARP